MLKNGKKMDILLHKTKNWVLKKCRPVQKMRPDVLKLSTHADIRNIKHFCPNLPLDEKSEKLIGHFIT